MNRDELLQLSHRQPTDIVDDLQRTAEKDITGLLASALAYQRGLALAHDLEALIPELEAEAVTAAAELAKVNAAIAGKESELAENQRQWNERGNGGDNRQVETELMTERRGLSRELQALQGEHSGVRDAPAALAGRVRAIKAIVLALRTAPQKDQAVLTDLRKLLRG